MNTALKAGGYVSMTAEQDSAVKRAITTIPSGAWTPIQYNDVIFDEATRTWISKAEVAEVEIRQTHRRQLNTSRSPASQLPDRLPPTEFG